MPHDDEIVARVPPVNFYAFGSVTKTELFGRATFSKGKRCPRAKNEERAEELLGRVHELFFKMFEMPEIRCESGDRRWTRFRIATEPV